MVDSIESSLTQVCMLCFEKTATVEKEDGEVILCEKCKKDESEHNIQTISCFVCKLNYHI